MTVPVTGERPRLDHAEAMRLARTEYERLAELLESLSGQDWAQPTECSPWTVRDLATHLLGYMRASCSVREQVRQLRAAKTRGGSIADAMTALQVEELADLTPEAITREVRERIDGAVRGRSAVPGVARRWVRIAADLPVAGTAERWSLGYMVDVIATRDGWMHRMDLCRALERPLQLTADHDGWLVADVVAEWAQRHRRPFELQLTGPAGGQFTQGTDGPALTFDTVQFCRLLSGRDGSPVFDTEVPF